MNIKKFISILAAISMLPIVETVVPQNEVKAASTNVVSLNPADASPFNDGKFEGWGTSLCWWANRLGYSEKLTEQASKAFFSNEGLGLDIARYNLGGGDDPTHNHITRSDSKIPGIWDEFEISDDGKTATVTKYDITKDKNQLNIAKAALKANPDLYFEGFSNSPPYFMTNSGCSSGAENAGSNNLKDDMYDDFGKFIAEATSLFKEEGIEFKSYSPMNEPDTSYWGALSNKQEGCHYDPGTSQSNAIIETRKALDNAGLNDVIVAGMDETDINKTVTNYAKLSDEAKTALGRIDTHTYNGSNRSGAKATAKNAGKTLWMSEVDGGWDGFGLADRIITDLNGMQAAAWVMWDIVDLHKDSNFTNPNGEKSESNNSVTDTSSLWGVAMADHDTEELKLTNKYYAFGQFSRYIEPGMTLIASSNSTLAAYDKITGKIVVVAPNSSSSDKDISIDVSAFTKHGNTAKVVRTSDSGEKWAELDDITLSDGSLDTTLKARSVTTYIIDGQTGVGEFSANANGLSYEYSLSYEDENKDSYFAVYDADGKLKAVEKNKKQASLSGDFSNCTYKLMVWDGMKPVCKAIDTTADNVDYAFISGGGSQLSLGASVQLAVQTNMVGDAVWSVSDSDIAEISQTGVLTSLKPGTVTVFVEVNGFKASKTIVIPEYTVTGSASWSSSSSAPSDSNDYLKATDGDLSTHFDGTQNGYVMYDFGTPYKPSEIKLAARSGNSMPERMIGGAVQGSNDGISWTDLYNVTAALPSDQYTVLTSDMLNNQYAYRYFRYTNTQNMTNIAEFLISGEKSDDVAENEPTIKDIAEFTDNFEGYPNIFSAENGTLSSSGNIVYTTSLSRFGNVFIPIKSTAKAETENITLLENQKFRFEFDMFSGWESNGKNNTFSLKDSDGNEILGYTISGGGYNLNQMRIGGTDLLADVSDKPVIQCKSSATRGANGWDHASQPYANNVGYNKHVVIMIDGTGAVSVEFNGGNSDLSYSGQLTTPISIKSIEFTGNCNAAAGRVVSYDNLNADVITYAQALATPSPSPTATPTAAPTSAPVLPENNELINLNFDNEDLTSTSSYGKAEGTPKFATVDGKKCAEFDNTASTAISLTDANGNSLLSGIDEFTVSYKFKPTSTATSWWFFAAPNDNAQIYKKEKYVGNPASGGKLIAERYNNSGSRPASVSGTYNSGEWNDVSVIFADGVTTVYVNGVKTEQTSDVNISNMLGNSSVAYIGRANWGSGEYATGYIDDFVITKGAAAVPIITMPNLTDLTENAVLPSMADDGSSITWTTSNADVISADGVITRQDNTASAVLTATIEKDGKTYTNTYNATVLGYAESVHSFAAYAENNSVYYSSEYDSTLTPYTVKVTLNNDSDTEVASNNEANGSFDSLEKGLYKITFTLYNNNDAVTSVTKTVEIKEEKDMEAYLFVHFVGTESSAEQEQIYFSVSQDGTSWKTLNGGKPILTSEVGEKGVRDPYVLRGEDGKFFVIATDLSIYNRRGDSNRWATCQTSGSQKIVVWESDDLVNWSEANLVKVAADNAGCTWAPEAIYDPEKNAYMVFWASKTSDDNYAVQRMYRSYTKDFKTFTEPEIYIDGGNISNIDTTITSYKGKYYRFTKNESYSSVDMMVSTSLSGPWKNVETYSLGKMTGYEGPTIYKLNGEDKWCLLLDYYSKSQGYKPFVTSDISKGDFASASDFSFDTKYRHGTVMPITQAEYESLTTQYPTE